MTLNPSLAGILNITPDSFSDGGLYLQPQKAIAHARKLAREGAHIIDLGPASSRPDAAPVSPAEEIRRLAPVFAPLKKDGLLLSVDSPLPETQIWALNQGAHFLNDIHGFPHASIYPRLKDASCRLILMHALQTQGPADRRPPPSIPILDHICRFFDNRLNALAKAGIDPQRIILDPGMGFFLGNKAETSFSVLASLPRLKKKFRLPILVSVSRKSFLRNLTGAENPRAATLSAEIAACLNGADYIRTHEPQPLRDAILTWNAVHQSETKAETKGNIC